MLSVPVKPPGRGPLSVLIVEDDCLIAVALEDTLSAAGFHVCGMAASETDAIEMARIHRPEFALVDVRLQPGDGRRVAATLTGELQTTVIMTTSEPLSAVEGCGAVAFLRKPYDFGLIPRALDVASSWASGAEATDVPAAVVRLPGAREPVRPLRRRRQGERPYPCPVQMARRPRPLVRGGMLTA